MNETFFKCYLLTKHWQNIEKDIVLAPYSGRIAGVKYQLSAFSPSNGGLEAAGHVSM